MNTEDRKKLIQKYRAGVDAVIESVEGLSEASLDIRAAEGEWTPREIVHHLADSEMTSAIRLRRLLAEDSPRIDGYDEEEFARRLHYDRPIDNSLAALRAARATTADILERLSEEEWQRSGTHSEIGPYSVGTWLEIYANHAHDHAEQISRAVQTGAKT